MLTTRGDDAVTRFSKPAAAACDSDGCGSIAAITVEHSHSSDLTWHVSVPAPSNPPARRHYCSSAARTLDFVRLAALLAAVRWLKCRGRRVCRKLRHDGISSVQFSYVLHPWCFTSVFYIRGMHVAIRHASIPLTHGLADMYATQAASRVCCA
jgi:hypothetical protein